MTRPDKISGKSILIIDDFFESGATVNELSRILWEAGTKEIYVLTLTKTRRKID